MKGKPMVRTSPAVLTVVGIFAKLAYASAFVADFPLHIIPPKCNDQEHAVAHLCGVRLEQGL